MEPVTIYFVGGADTPPELFRPLADALRNRFDAERRTVHLRTIQAYGNLSEGFGRADGGNGRGDAAGAGGGVMKHWYAAGRDARLKPGQAEQSIGGQRVLRQVRVLGARMPLLFVGHGGGGVAAYHAAELLEREGCDVRFVAQVGSPKVPISSGFRGRVGYLAKKGIGVEGDPLTWQGSWAHDNYKLSAHRYPGLLYSAAESRTRLYAPERVELVDIRGQHPSYFSPMKGKGPVSNLAKSLNVLWEWFGQAL